MNISKRLFRGRILWGCIFGGSALLLSACGAETGETGQFGSSLGDIYKADNDPKRRHKATAEEILWTIKINGCTGSLLTPNLVLTAEHCSIAAGDTFTSGSALLAAGEGKAEPDIEVKEKLEFDATYDYAIFEIKWLNAEAKMPANQKMPSGIATKREDYVVSKEADQGDFVFTVGFPVDKRKWGATFAKGQLKEHKDQYVRYNVGIINGNSGGPIFRISDNLLISQTNGGRKAHGMPDWNNNDVNDPKAWNLGGILAEVYQKSELLKKTYPDGKNPHYKGNPVRAF